MSSLEELIVALEKKYKVSICLESKERQLPKLSVSRSYSHSRDESINVFTTPLFHWSAEIKPTMGTEAIDKLSELIKDGQELGETLIKSPLNQELEEEELRLAK